MTVRVIRFRLAALAALSLASLTFSAAPAAADPVSLAIGGINALLALSGTAAVTSGTALLTVGTTTLLTVGQAVGAALAIGGSLLLSAFSGGGASGRGQFQADPGAAKGTFETPESGEIRLLGRGRIGGVYFFRNAEGLNRWRLVGHCRGPIDGIEAHYLGGREVTVEPTGEVSSPPWAKPAGSWAVIRNKPGSLSETVWPGLSAAFPGKWTSAHRVNGIAQSEMKFISPGVNNPKFLTLYSSGTPEYQITARGERIFDPRDGVTRWSDNGVLCVLHILLTVYNKPAADIAMAFTAVEARRADEPVPIRGGGTEPRSRFGGPWNEATVARGDLMRDALLSTGTELVTVVEDGRQKIGIRLIDDSRPPEVFVEARDIIDFSFKSGPDGVKRPNRLTLKYYSPERNYELHELLLVRDREAIPSVPLPWSVAAGEIARVGEQVMPVSLPYCPSPAQAQRIARRLFAQARADTGLATLNMTGLALWGARTVSFAVPDLPEPVIAEILPPREDRDSGVMRVAWVARPALAPWDPDADEAAPPDLAPEIGISDVLAQPAAPTEIVTLTYPVSGQTVTRMRHAYPGAGLTAEATCRQIVSGVPGPWLSMTEQNIGTSFSVATVVADLSGVPAQGRVRHFNAEEDGSNWSPLLAATPAIVTTAPAAPTISGGFVDNGGGEYTITLTITAPNDLHVAGILRSGDFSGTTDAVPAQVYTVIIDVTSPGLRTFTVRALATGGAQSAPASVAITIP